MQRTSAFTLIEILIVVTIVAILVGLLVVGVLAVRERARVTQAKALIPMLDQALGIYRTEDLMRRFPAQPASGWIEFAATGASPLIGDRLDGVGLGEISSRQAVSGSANRVLVDPWGVPVEYRLDANMNGTADRPQDEDGVAVQVPGDVSDWNPRGLEPFAYVWSWGRPRADGRKHGRAGDWIYVRQDPKQP